MGFFFWTTGVPLGLFGLAAIVAIAMFPDTSTAGAIATGAVLWLLFTAKARKTYWNARIRTRGSYDERRARTRAAK